MSAYLLLGLPLLVLLAVGLAVAIRRTPPRDPTPPQRAPRARSNWVTDWGQHQESASVTSGRAAGPAVGMTTEGGRSQWFKSRSEEREWTQASPTHPQRADGVRRDRLRVLPDEIPEGPR